MPDWTKKAKFRVAKTVDPYLKQFLPKEEADDEIVAGRDVMVYVKSKRELKPEEDVHWSTTMYEVSHSS